MTVGPSPCPPAGWMLSASPVFQKEIRRVFSGDTQVCPTIRGIATGEGSQHGTHSGAQFMTYLDRLPLNHEKTVGVSQLYGCSTDLTQLSNSGELIG